MQGNQTALSLKGEVAQESVALPYSFLHREVVVHWIEDRLRFCDCEIRPVPIESQRTFPGKGKYKVYGGDLIVHSQVRLRAVGRGVLVSPPREPSTRLATGYFEVNGLQSQTSFTSSPLVVSTGTFLSPCGGPAIQGCSDGR